MFSVMQENIDSVSACTQYTVHVFCVFVCVIVCLY